MAETKNYGLYLEDDDSTRFADWRRKMNGGTGSNMEKIDEALSDKADKSVSTATVLSASDWVGETAPYRQELSVPGIAAASNGSISLSPSLSAEQVTVAARAVLSVDDQSENTLTIRSDGEKPGVDIPVVVVVVG